MKLLFYEGIVFNHYYGQKSLNFLKDKQTIFLWAFYFQDMLDFCHDLTVPIMSIIRYFDFQGNFVNLKLEI